MQTMQSGRGPTTNVRWRTRRSCGDNCVQRRRQRSSPDLRHGEGLHMVARRGSAALAVLLMAAAATGAAQAKGGGNGGGGGGGGGHTPPPPPPAPAGPPGAFPR